VIARIVRRERRFLARENCERVVGLTRSRRSRATTHPREGLAALMGLCHTRNHTCALRGLTTSIDIFSSLELRESGFHAA
jgi:hypothetical protein